MKAAGSEPDKDALVLNVVYPQGSSKEVSFPIRYSVLQALGLAIQEQSSLHAKDLLVVADPQGVPRFLNLGSQLRECQLSQKSTIWLFRKEQVCVVVCSDGSRRRLLVDFATSVSTIILYFASKLGVKDFHSLLLYAYGSSEVLRGDKSLEDQGITPFTKLFCLTVGKDEVPFFPPDVVEQSPSTQSEANLLNVPEEMLVRATKRGFLMKLSTKKGKYNPRLFVLQDSDLYYYTEAKAKKAKNVLHDAIAAPVEEETLVVPEKVKSSTLRKVKKEFDFVVSAGDKTLKLQAKTPEEGASWIAAINAANSQESNTGASGGSRKVGAIFRNKLSAAVKVTDGSEIPQIVVKAIEFLDKQSILKVVGLFRLSGSAPLIKRLSEEFDLGKNVDFSLIADPHAVTGLLKMYFRDLEEPLLTWALYGAFTAAGSADCLYDRVRHMRQVIELLPPLNRATLALLMKFLSKVASYSDYNKMPLHNVATVFAPNILKDRDASLLQVVESSPLVNNAIITILQYQAYLLHSAPFPVPADLPPARLFARVKDAYLPAVPAIGDLPLQEDQVVAVLSQGSEGWWLGHCAGRYGRFPGAYVQLLDEKENEKMRKKLKIDVKIQEMREQADYQDRLVLELTNRKQQLEAQKMLLEKEKELLKQSDFPDKVRALSASMPHFVATGKQYRVGLEKLLTETEASVSLQQELLISLNSLWSAANNPKLAKKYKKVVTKFDPQLAVLKASLQESISQKRQNVDVRADLVKDLYGTVDLLDVKK